MVGSQMDESGAQRRGETDQMTGNSEEGMEGGRLMVQSEISSLNTLALSWLLHPERFLLAALANKTIRS